MANSTRQTPQSVVQLLGPLRRKAARYRGGSTDAGDELVELTLRVALSEESNRPAEISLYRWLNDIMKRHLN
ncbi:hypothetical protein P9272_28380 [Mesorhizobium sp. WSM4976]|uniref:hypothetical protein n=1 Tax=Mesorhizobium sp. WSM4976 TaxID=3038549 RepID=UPI00241696B0|nr:hypothetical protein [Mesorhizobium sp. WSM4976]MDG4897471.1 hypothetical protein [Mesorhizobium sp. WSM4976]